MEGNAVNLFDLLKYFKFFVFDFTWGRPLSQYCAFKIYDDKWMNKLTKEII